MKTILFIITLLASATTFSAPVDVLLNIQDAFTGKALAEIEIIILSDEGVELAKGESDRYGKYKATITLSKKAHEIRILFKDPSGFFEGKEVFLFKNKSNSFISNVHLGPSAKTYALWHAKEDSIYGGIHEGVLAKEENTESLICGCPKDDFNEAQFMGGQDAMYEFIGSKLSYPQESIEMNEQGKVYIKFIIEEDGKLSHIEIERGASPNLNAEAYRVTTLLQNWQPANCNGKKVRSIGRLPYIFTLN